MTNPDAGPGEPGFRDRGGRLIFFGSLAVLLGAACGLLALLSLLLPFLGELLPAPEAAGDTRSALLGFLTYGLAGAILVWAGAGSLRQRRWVRPVMLSVAWTWLFVGAFGLLTTLALLDDLPYLARSDGEPWPPEIVVAVQATVLGVVVIGGLFLPALFLWAYRDEQVLHTCRRHDPEPGWADRCPWPVLLLSLELGLAALLTLFMALRPVVPLFGTLVTGRAGALLLLAAAALLGRLALAVYRCSMRAWWATTLLLVAVGLSVGVTSWVVDPVLLYRELGYPEPASAAPVRFVRAVGVWGSLGFTLLSLIYMGAIRRRFIEAVAERPPGIRRSGRPASGERRAGPSRARGPDRRKGP
jgi:hypothetical protein